MVERPLRERWFTRPWRPWVRERPYTPKIPMKDALIIMDPTLTHGERCIVMHPDTWHEYAGRGD